MPLTVDEFSIAVEKEKKTIKVIITNTQTRHIPYKWSGEYPVSADDDRKDFDRWLTSILGHAKSSEIRKNLLDLLGYQTCI